MSYKVVKAFIDLQDDNHMYCEGDTFPRNGVEASDKRIAELASDANKCNMVLIEAVEVPQKAKIQPQTNEKAKADKSVDKAASKPKKAKEPKKAKVKE